MRLSLHLPGTFVQPESVYASLEAARLRGHAAPFTLPRSSYAREQLRAVQRAAQSDAAVFGALPAVGMFQGLAEGRPFWAWVSAYEPVPIAHAEHAPRDAHEAVSWLAETLSEARPERPRPALPNRNEVFEASGVPVLQRAFVPKDASRDDGYEFAFLEYWYVDASAAEAALVTFEYPVTESPEDGLRLCDSIALDPELVRVSLDRGV